uniref:DEDD_Tnp_IS110 domain-containing protein n=1 Tax=Ascaris lumbricoides TaxID=6252 RepID=A0A0M3HHD3_ASCLU
MDAIAKCAFGVDVGSQHGNSLFAKYAREILNFTLWDPRVLFISMFCIVLFSSFYRLHSVISNI